MKIKLFERIQLQAEISNEHTTFENITEEFIKNYCYSVVRFISIENGISFDEAFDKAKYGLFDFILITKRTELFLEWLGSKGENYFIEIINRLEQKNLSDKAYAFAKLYNHLLQKAINSNNKEMLLDNLYFVPEEMFREYTQFGFLKNIYTDIEMLSSQFHVADSIIIKCKINGRSAKQVSCFA